MLAEYGCQAWGDCLLDLENALCTWENWLLNEVENAVLALCLSVGRLFGHLDYTSRWKSGLKLDI